jgi:antitoxin component HigA of HigAB toxin-antitoxin module
MRTALLLAAACLAVLAALPGSAAQATAILDGKKQVVVRSCTALNACWLLPAGLYFAGQHSR